MKVISTRRTLEALLQKGEDGYRRAVIVKYATSDGREKLRPKFWPLKLVTRKQA